MAGTTTKSTAKKASTTKTSTAKSTAKKSTKATTTKKTTATKNTKVTKAKTDTTFGGLYKEIQVTGINKAGIDKIKNAIDAYVKDIEAARSVAANQTNIEQAIKGASTEASLRQMNKSITASLSSLLARLNRFKTTLDNVYASYQKQDASNTAFTDAAKQASNIK